MAVLRSLGSVVIALLLIAAPGNSASAQARWVERLNPIPNEDMTIFFASGSSSLTNEAKSVLGRQAKILLVYPKDKVIVYGYADPFEAGSRQEAWDLGLKRAVAAMYYLIAQGVPAARLRPDSRGYESIVMTHDTPEGRAAMRIVTTEVQLPPGHWTGMPCLGRAPCGL